MQPSSADSGVSQTSSGPRVVIERPAPGLARGKYAWPAWGIGALGIAIVVVGLAYFLVRLRRARGR